MNGTWIRLQFGQFRRQGVLDLFRAGRYFQFECSRNAFETLEGVAGTFQFVQIFEEVVVTQPVAFLFEETGNGQRHRTEVVQTGANVLGGRGGRPAAALVAVSAATFQGSTPGPGTGSGFRLPAELIKTARAALAVQTVGSGSAASRRPIRTGSIRRFAVAFQAVGSVQDRVQVDARPGERHPVTAQALATGHRIGSHFISVLIVLEHKGILTF